MNQQDHIHEPEPDHRPDRYRAWSRRRWWTIGLVGVAGLTLTAIGVAATPAVDVLPPDDRAEKAHQPSRDDRGKEGDQGKRDYKNQGKKGKRGKEPPGTPVPCDADALIAAITLANAHGGATLNLASKCTYLLTADIDGAGLPAITTPITLNGHTHTTIERAAAADEFRILTVNVGGDLTLNKLRLTGGQTTGDGGAILVNPGGALTTNHSTITRNIADGDGGGIANNGTTRIKDSTISQNTATGSDGGGIFNSGLLTIDTSHIRSNNAVAGGGVASSAGTVQIEDSTISANEAGSGGGLALTNTSGTVVDTHVTHNVAEQNGGIRVLGGQLTLRSVVLAQNSATLSRVGGLAVESSTPAVVEDSIITGNTAAKDGGGIYNAGNLVVRRTEISGNQAEQGGGIDNTALGTAALYSTKITNNVALIDGGGIFNDGGTVNLNTATGTVVINNRPDNCVNVPGCAG
ncbi:right-handed parallel beta-helix repeat-containing protein [Salinispora mooreana]|uniref:right-handed parallel beta-helix repeat-containing protein n=1 Tax=Salinispora mooreana TaxID=999545 RepID=UPI00039CA577|nr:right-handed parallel beta-helix repeat-containing protein [Salinispora mooreana]